MFLVILFEYNLYDVMLKKKNYNINKYIYVYIYIENKK